MAGFSDYQAKSIIMDELTESKEDLEAFLDSLANDFDITDFNPVLYCGKIKSTIQFIDPPGHGRKDGR